MVADSGGMTEGGLSMVMFNDGGNGWSWMIDDSVQRWWLLEWCITYTGGDMLLLKQKQEL